MAKDMEELSAYVAMLEGAMEVGGRAKGRGGRGGENGATRLGVEDEAGMEAFEHLRIAC